MTIERQCVNYRKVKLGYKPKFEIKYSFIILRSQLKQKSLLSEPSLVYLVAQIACFMLYKT